MNDNSKSLFFLIVSFGCFWLVLDEYYGQKYLSKLVDGLGIGAISVGDSIANSATDTATDIVDKVTDGKASEATKDGKEFIEANKKYSALPKSLRQYMVQYMTDTNPTQEGRNHILDELFAHKNWTTSDKLTARGALIAWWAKNSSKTHTDGSGNTAGGTGGSF